MQACQALGSVPVHSSGSQQLVATRRQETFIGSLFRTLAATSGGVAVGATAAVAAAILADLVTKPIGSGVHLLLYRGMFPAEIARISPGSSLESVVIVAGGLTMLILQVGAPISAATHLGSGAYNRISSYIQNRFTRPLIAEPSSNSN